VSNGAFFNLKVKISVVIIEEIAEKLKNQDSISIMSFTKSEG
jgi:hypothetical protein